MTGVEPHVLRYWESLFRELSPAKNRAGKRVYKDSDIQVILTLKDLIQKNKYSSAGARKVLRDQKKTETESKSGTVLSHEVTRDLGRIRVFLDDLLSKI